MVVKIVTAFPDLDIFPKSYPRPPTSFKDIESNALYVFDQALSHVTNFGKASNEALRRSELFKYFQYGKEKSLKTFVSFVLLLYNEKPRFFYRLCLLEAHRLLINRFDSQHANKRPISNNKKLE